MESLRKTLESFHQNLSGFLCSSHPFFGWEMWFLLSSSILVPPRLTPLRWILNNVRFPNFWCLLLFLKLSQRSHFSPILIWNLENSQQQEHKSLNWPYREKIEKPIERKPALLFLMGRAHKGSSHENQSTADRILTGALTTRVSLSKSRNLVEPQIPCL